jgi:hypothetical protein
MLGASGTLVLRPGEGKVLSKALCKFIGSPASGCEGKLKAKQLANAMK